jgi:transposase
MPGKARKIVITETQQQILIALRDARTSPKHLAQRAAIVLLGFEKLSNEQIARQVGVGRHQVGVWRRRWQHDWERLTCIECAETRARLERAIRETLSDAPRPGSPGKFTPEQVAQIYALACEPPENSGRPITHWTHVKLADELARRGIVESISATRVGELLREAKLKPHKSRYWLNTKEKDPAAFQQQVATVCDTYRGAPRQAHEHGTHTVSTDEMTGIQALERIAATKPTQPDRPARVEFEYQRHGTQTLIANLEVTTGELISPTIGATRTEEDFAQHVAATVATDPEAPWVFVVDQLNIHVSESLVRYVAKSCGLDEPLGKKRQSGRAEIDGNAERIPVAWRTSHPVCVSAQTFVLAEPDRGGVLGDRAQGDPPRKFHVAPSAARSSSGFHPILQQRVRQTIPLDLHRPTSAN